MTWGWLLSVIDNRRKKMYHKDIGSLLELLSPKKEDRVLDVGAGLGTVANIVAEVSDEVFALEPDEKRVEYIKAKHPQVKAFSATASQIPFPTSYFDKLYTIAAFHHFPDQDDALEEFSRVTKKGGLVLIHEIDPSNGSGKRLKFFERKIVRNKANFLAREELKKLVLAHGFKALKERKANRGYFFLAQNEKTRNESKGWVDANPSKSL